MCLNVTPEHELTSAGVDLQLPVDVALVHQGVEDVEDTVDVPDLRVVPQKLDFLLGLLGCFAAVLTEGLELWRKRSRFPVSIKLDMN